MNEADGDRTEYGCFYFANRFFNNLSGKLLSRAQEPRFLGRHSQCIPAIPGIRDYEPKSGFHASVGPDPTWNLYSAKQAMAHFLLIVLPFESTQKFEPFSSLPRNTLYTIHNIWPTAFNNPQDALT